VKWVGIFWATALVILTMPYPDKALKIVRGGISCPRNARNADNRNNRERGRDHSASGFVIVSLGLALQDHILEPGDLIRGKLLNMVGPDIHGPMKLTSGHLRQHMSR